MKQFKWEKHNRNVTGLNKKDFKFFKYDDPYEKVNVKNCDVCNNIVHIDQFGQGKCDICGWEQNPGVNPNCVQYPNMVSLNKAKRLYNEGKQILPDFDDFIEALYMYSEVEFYYKNKYYGVLLVDDGIEFTQGKSYEIFKTKEDFENKANIDGILLTKLWKDVKDADYMQG